MLISFKQSISKHDLRITGVIHVGAHFGQEYHDYKAAGIKDIFFIEPCEKAFNVLSDTFDKTPGVILCCSGCGSEVDVLQMNTEQANQGMSNSLLKPAKHLQQYPSIQFTGTEEVEIHPLDTLMEHYGAVGNLLVMDVQGYELEVLKGATNTLKSIDYVYTEVNRDEVYENCARVEQLDEYLTDFTRVETNWAGNSWGDAWYIRKTLLSNGK
jgi:FkbM family methyltransferase